MKSDIQDILLDPDWEVRVSILNLSSSVAINARNRKSFTRERIYEGFFVPLKLQQSNHSEIEEREEF